MSQAPERRYESAYDPESNLRVVRFAGRLEVDWLIVTAPYDPTHKHLPHCLTLIDQRDATFAGGPSQVAELAADMTKLVGPHYSERYAWVVSRMETVGIAMHYQSSVGAGRIRWFTTIEEACAHLGVTVDDFARAEAMLAPVEADL
jgi:hypothetical protein